MNIQIITPEKVLYKGLAKAAIFPGLDGSFGVLNKHAPLISGLKEGVIKVTIKSKFKSGKIRIETFPIKGGVVEVLKNKVTVLVED